MLKKKIWPNFPRIIEVFTQKIVTKPSIIWVWDPGSGIRDPRSGIRVPEKPIPDPGSRGQKGTDPGSRIRIRNTGYRYQYLPICSPCCYLFSTDQLDLKDNKILYCFAYRY